MSDLPRSTRIRIRVWDFPVRLFHWLLAASFLLAFISAESERWREVHVNAGYAMAALIGFRLIWGFVGSRYARFADFVPTPRRIGLYLAALRRGRTEHYVGHNPIGALAIFVLLGLGLASVVSGWATLEQAGAARWAHFLEELHEGVANGMLLMVFLHLGGVVVSSLLHRENLVRAMITGWKIR